MPSFFTTIGWVIKQLLSTLPFVSMTEMKDLSLSYYPLHRKEEKESDCLYSAVLCLSIMSFISGCFHILFESREKTLYFSETFKGSRNKKGKARSLVTQERN